MWRGWVVEPKLYQTLESWRSNWHFICGDCQISIFIECSIRTTEACQPLKRHYCARRGTRSGNPESEIPYSQMILLLGQTTAYTFLSYFRLIIQNVQTHTLKSITKHFLQPTANNNIRYL
jgi:hypothetical protein